MVPPEVSSANPLTLNVNNDANAQPRYSSPSSLNSSTLYLPSSQINGPLSAGSNIPRGRARRSRSTVKDSEDDDNLSTEDKEQERRSANNTRYEKKNRSKIQMSIVGWDQIKAVFV